MSEFKQRQVFSDAIHQEDTSPDLQTQQLFEEAQSFSPMVTEQESDLESEVESLIRPKKKRRWLARGLLATFTGLAVWQGGDNVVTAFQAGDWLLLGWVGFWGTLAALGLGALVKELLKLRRLRGHFDIQEQSRELLLSDSVGKGTAFCENLTRSHNIASESVSYDRWKHAIAPSHSDAEILELYEGMVIAEQDKRATAIVSRYALESGTMVALSPLAAADMLLVAWRNFKMIDELSNVYGVELGYASRIKLMRYVLVNMAAAGATELAMDASMDALSMELAGRVSARAGQGLGVGILSARLGLKAMELLRPIPWREGRQARLGTIRKQLVSKITSITKKA